MRGFEFVPVSVGTFGTWGKRGLNFIKKIGKLKTDKTYDEKATSYLIQALIFALQLNANISIDNFVHFS